MANLGVIAGILFLAYEIRLSNQIAVATTEIALRESYGSGNETVYGNPAIAEILFKKHIVLPLASGQVSTVVLHS